MSQNELLLLFVVLGLLYGVKCIDMWFIHRTACITFSHLFLIFLNLYPVSIPVDPSLHHLEYSISLFYTDLRQYLGLRFDLDLVREVPSQNFPVGGFVALSGVASSVYCQSLIEAELIV